MVLSCSMPKHVQKRTPKPTTEGRGKRNPRAVQEEGDRGLSPSDLESIAKLVAAKLKGAEVGGTPEPTPGPSHEGSGSNLEVSALSDLATLTDLPDPGQLFNINADLGSTVPEAIKHKIWNGDFINLGLLLPRNLTSVTETNTTSLSLVGG